VALRRRPKRLTQSRATRRRRRARVSILGGDETAIKIKTAKEIRIATKLKTARRTKTQRMSTLLENGSLSKFLTTMVLPMGSACILSPHLL
jgi:hypothetical protein